MPIDILMPALSPTMKTGNLAKWVKKEGDKIKPGEVIAEIETDKATMEVESIEDGVIAKILIAEGTEDVAVGSLIAIILQEGESKNAIESYLQGKNVPSNENEQANVSKDENKLAAFSGGANKEERVFASPLAKRIANQNNIDLKNVQGSGPKGRIIKEDIMQVLKKPASERELCHVSTQGIKDIQGLVNEFGESYIEVSNNNVRKVIAKKLVESKQEIPHFYLTIDCELGRLMTVRQEMNLAASATMPYKLSINDFIIKAASLALKEVPEANSSWGEGAIKRYNDINISVAVAIDGGLITPIIRNADVKPISVISNEMKLLAEKARNGLLKPHEFQGGTFSISNLGMYGIKQFNAIINPPQACILAIGATESKPVVKNKAIEIAEVMTVTLSCDHRVIDGAVAARLLSAFRSRIENPLSMLA